MVKPIGLSVWGDDDDKPAFAILWLTEDIATDLLYLMDKADALGRTLIIDDIGTLTLMEIRYLRGIKWYRYPDEEVEEYDLLESIPGNDGLQKLPANIVLGNTEEEEEVECTVCIVTPRSVCWKCYTKYWKYGSETSEITRTELEGMKW